VNARWRFILITLATLVAVGVTGSLGFWQLSRAAEKQSRQTAMDTQSAKLPLTADALHAAPDGAGLLHQRARLRGNWHASSLVFLENRPMAGRVGFLVLMPFELEGGKGALVVQRGWVPRGFVDRALLPRIDTPAGIVEVEGRMSLPPSDLYALGPPTSGAIRQNLDLPQWRTETGLQLMPLSLQQTGASPEGFLRDWPVVNLGVEKNYGYAAQWFGMAGLFALLYLWFQVIRRFIFHPKDPTPDA
jgi:surfeit locus 1 family protein